MKSTGSLVEKYKKTNLAKNLERLSKFIVIQYEKLRICVTKNPRHSKVISPEETPCAHPKQIFRSLFALVTLKLASFVSISPPTAFIFL